jgi:hypothetical protein
MKHVLDRPIWSALDTQHACFSLGDSLARRYPPSIVPFATAAADGTENLRALDELIAPHESVLMLQAEPIVLPPRLRLVSTATGVQMIADKPLQTASDPRLQPLAEDDAAEMLALASLTRPGPFTLRALSLGEFWV